MARGAAARARALGNGGRRREERSREEGGNWSTGMDRDGLEVDIPAVALSWGAPERATAKQEVEEPPWAFAPLPEGRRKKTPLPLVGWASSGRQVRFSSFLSIFFLFCFSDLLTILICFLFQLQNSL